MVTTRRQVREQEETTRRRKLRDSISNDIRKRRRTLLNSIAAEGGITSKIFLRLPVEALSRFKCISKSWYTLLHEPLFIKSHLNRSIRNNNFAFMIYTDWDDTYSVGCDISSSSVKLSKAVMVERPFISYKPRFQIYGSCNGIFLIRIFHQFNRICLWNPTTREYKDLSQQFPETPKYPRDLYPYEYISYWLGYDVSTDDYKVIKIAYYYNYNIRTISDVHVYSLRTDSCKRIIQDLPYSIYGVVLPDQAWDGGILLNGAIHWFGNQGSTIYKLPFRIVTFNLVNEDFKDFQLPDVVFYSKSIQLGMFEDCLCVYSLNRDSYIDMFVMKEYGVKESWTKMFSIIDQSFDAMKNFRALRITNDGKLLVQWNYKDLALYDPKHGGHRCGNIKIQGIPRRVSNYFRVETYVKSLVSLGSNTYVNVI